MQKALLFIFFCLCFILPTESIAQQVYKSTNGIIVMDYSEEGVLEEKGDSIFRYLFGSVEIRQDSVFMYADTALVLNDTLLFANGNILIQQGDSVSILSNKLTYNSNSRSALLDEDVVLLSSDQRLYTPNLIYDLNSRIATFNAGALLTNDSTQLVSKRGYFNTAADEAVFRDSVRVVGNAFNLQADSILYNTKTKTVDFLSPTLIKHEVNRIYCEGGFYQVEEGKAVLTKNPQYVGEDLSAEATTIKYDEREGLVELVEDARLLDSLSLMKAEVINYFEESEQLLLIEDVSYQKEDVVVYGDTALYYREEDKYELFGTSNLNDGSFQVFAEEKILFNNETGSGVANGHVVLRDTSNNTSIFCDSTRIKNSGDDLVCLGSPFGRPYSLMESEDGDSLFMVSDTLLFETVKDSIVTDSVISRKMKCFSDVRIYGNSIQAVCDSLDYAELDSIFTLYGDPVAWSDSSQFSSMYMQVQMANDAVDRMILSNKAFVINSTDLIFFNQMKGRRIDVIFKADTINHLTVNGNVESIYFIQDEEDAYVGMNKMLSANMKMFLSENKVKRLTFFQQPDGSTIPMTQVGSNPEKLSDFNWDLTYRPTSFKTLFMTEKARRAKPVEQEKPIEDYPDRPGGDANNPEEGQEPKPESNGKKN